MKLRPVVTCTLTALFSSGMLIIGNAATTNESKSDLILPKVVSTKAQKNEVNEVNVKSIQSINFIGATFTKNKDLKSDIQLVLGEVVTRQKLNEALQSLYATGYFSDIKVDFQTSTGRLIFTVVERPIISVLKMTGNSLIKTKNLKSALNSMGLSQGKLYNPALLKQVKSALEDQYSAMGYYSARVNFKVGHPSKDRVTIHLDISEGKQASVRGITFIGQSQFSKHQLLKTLDVSTPSILNLWNLFGTADYSTPLMQKSVEGLHDFFLNQGYYDFALDSSQVSLTPTKEDVYLNFNFSKDAQYHIKNIRVTGDMVLSNTQIQSMLSIHAGDLFSKKEVEKSVNKIVKALGGLGYAFAKVAPIPTVDEKTHEIQLNFYVKPGKRVYVRYIRFHGNNITNDSVLRRNFNYYEGSLYDTAALARSKLKLLQLPYIQILDIKKVPVAGTNNQIDMDYFLKEKSANTVSAQIGWSGLFGAMIGGSLNLGNLAGEGNQFSLSTQLSKPYQILNMSYTNPYFTQSGISQTVSMNISNMNTSGINLVDYALDTYSANLSYGFPIDDFDVFNFGGGINHSILRNSSNPKSETVAQFLRDHGGVFNTFTTTMGWVRNTANSAYYPSAGNILNLNGEIAVPGSSLEYYRVNSSAQLFQGFTHKITLSLKTGLGYGHGYGKMARLPFFDNYYAGGWGSVRGYTDGSMGPLDALEGSTNAGNALGGNLNIYANIDLLMPIPGMTDSDTMRWGVFADAGNVYNTYKLTTIDASAKASPRYPDFANLRYSVGVEFRWYSPVGPMAFSVAYPLNQQKGDQTSWFQFSLGQSF